MFYNVVSLLQVSIGRHSCYTSISDERRYSMRSKIWGIMNDRNQQCAPPAKICSPSASFFSNYCKIEAWCTTTTLLYMLHPDDFARCTIEYRTTIASGFYRRKVDFYTKPPQKYHTGHKVRISYSVTFIYHLRLWVSGRKQTTTMLNNFKRNQS